MLDDGTVFDCVHGMAVTPMAEGAAKLNIAEAF
jgi:hypothetical protein